MTAKMPSKSKSCLMAVTGVFQLAGGIAAANRLAYEALQNAGYTIDILALNEMPSAATNNAYRQRSFANNKIRFIFAVWRALLSRSYTLVFCDHINLAAILLPLRVFIRKPIIVRLNGVEVFPP